MKVLLLIVMAILLAGVTNGQTQTCTCENNFEWVKKTFEKNDAGFQYIIDKKGQKAYDIHNQLTIEKIKTAQSSAECLVFLADWLKFFRAGHIRIERLTSENTNSQEKWTIDIFEFEKYISEKTEADFEGIWSMNEAGEMKFGIKKEGENYVAFTIDAKKPARLVLSIKQEGDNLTTTYYAVSTSPYKIPNPVLLGNNTLHFGEWGTWKRVSPVFSEDAESLAIDTDYLKFLTATKPYLEELNPSTLYLRIPSFEQGAKRAIDSVLTANKNKILITENLIIDIRNGTGGSDESFQELIPLLYTNPIREVGIEFLSTELNNQPFIDFATDPEYQDSFDEDTRKTFRGYYDTLQSKLGEFVNLFGKEVIIIQLDTIYKYPKNVGIIINQNNASADEQFLLSAKQSKKVKLFGTTTFGSLDISNMHSINSPCEEFVLHYCLSRSLRIPDMAIDEIGIQPDYYLDKTIPQYKWVEFVNDILNK